MLSSLVIEDNNPNMLPMIVLILAVLYIVYSLISIKIKKNKKERLDETKKKIDKSHERFLLEEHNKRSKGNV